MSETAVTIPANIFRGYDLRGLVGSELTNEAYEILGKAYGTFLQKRGIRSTAVGYDIRLNSQEFASYFARGLNSVGVDVFDIGLSLTQIVYFSSYHFLTKGGAMVTASHNPKEFNGLKLSTGYSETMVTEEIQELRQIVQSNEFFQSSKLGVTKPVDIFPAYKNYILSLFPEKLNFKVLIDGGCVTPSKFLPEILRAAGCEVIERNTNLDGNFPLGTPDPTEQEVLDRLAQGVKESGADVGFTYDSDGDRIGIVDEKGGVIWNDVLVSIYSQEILSRSRGAKIIFNALCSKQVDEVIRANGGIPVMWKTGHSFIKAKVKEEHAPFGGELSGHFFFMDNFFGHDDGAVASLRLLDFMRLSGKKLSEIVSELPDYISSPEIKVGAPDAKKFQMIDEIIKSRLIAKYPSADTNTIDGIRLDLPDRMIIFRASQNGPYLTIKFEAKTQSGYDELKALTQEIVTTVQDIDLKSGVNLSSLGL